MNGSVFIPGRSFDPRSDEDGEDRNTDRKSMDHRVKAPELTGYIAP